MNDTSMPDPSLPVNDVEEQSLAGQLRAGARTPVNLRQVESAAAIGKGWVAITRRNATRQGNAQQAGFRTEEFHKATFNANAARKNLAVRADLTTGGSPADLSILEGQRVVGNAQIKNCKTVVRTTKAISARKYDGMQKVVPADQAESVRQLATKRGVDGLGERNYADTGQKAAARVEHGGASSKALTYEEAQNRGLGRRMVAGEVGLAAKAGAQSGAVIGGAMSTVSNIAAVAKGEKTALQAAGAIARETTLTAAGGAVSAAVTSGITAGCTRVGLQALSKGGAPGAIAATGIEVARDLAAWGKGDLTGTQVAGRGVEHAVGAGGAWGGALAGAALGAPIPVVGPLLGGVIGGMLGNAGVRKGIRKLKSWLR